MYKMQFNVVKIFNLGIQNIVVYELESTVIWLAVLLLDNTDNDFVFDLEGFIVGCK